MEICFVIAPGQNQFFVELVDAVRDELDQLGVANRVAVGEYPDAGKDTVFVLTPPHEYHALIKPRNHPTKRQLRRTIFLCGEQPGSWYFERNIELAEASGSPVFDINRWSISELRKRGVKARHFQLGWTRTWARHDPTKESPLETLRSIDVLHLGTRSARRERVLSENAQCLSRHNCVLSLGDNTAPLRHGDKDWVGGDVKWDLLGDTRVVLNIHRDQQPYFEWLRMVQAISNGAMIVSDWSLDCAPLIPGEHLLDGIARDLGLVAEMPLRDESYRHGIAANAYTTLRDALPMATAVNELLEVAGSLVGRSSRNSSSEGPSRASDPTPNMEIAGGKDVLPERTFGRMREEIEQVTNDPLAHLHTTVTKHLRDQALEIRRLHGDVTRLKLRAEGGGREPGLVEHVHRTPSYAGVAPRVSVITPLFNYERLVISALASVARCGLRDYELVIVDDGSTDGSKEAVRRWLEKHPAIPAILLTHPTNRGLGAARNSAISVARGKFAFMLDADNTVYPSGISRLLNALEADPTASFAYGMLERHEPDGNPVGLLSSYPWDPLRFGDGNYIDAMVLWRIQELRDLGLFTTDPMLWGWEDFELFLRLADAGGHGVFEPQFVARYRVSGFSMTRTMNMSSTAMGMKLIEMYPQIMAPDPVRRGGAPTYR
ncbi:MAG: glycosyltransferase family 2 protein [Thermoleophilaceae bacterium]|nr:glycosyltransferase family 2 protein [Thermoleophilaceae bacterium]